MFNPEYNGVSEPFELISSEILQELLTSRSICCVYQPKEQGPVKVLMSDIGEENFISVLMALLYNSEFHAFLKGAIVTADEMKKYPEKKYLLAERFIKYFRKIDMKHIKELYSD